MTLTIIIQLLIVLLLIFVGARKGGIGLGIYGMVGVFLLVFVFGLPPGKVPIDVMLIIASVITATAALQAAGGLDRLKAEAGARFVELDAEAAEQLAGLFARHGAAVHVFPVVRIEILIHSPKRNAGTPALDQQNDEDQPSELHRFIAAPGAASPNYARSPRRGPSPPARQASGSPDSARASRSL